MRLLSRFRVCLVGVGPRGRRNGEMRCGPHNGLKSPVARSLKSAACGTIEVSIRRRYRL